MAGVNLSGIRYIYEARLEARAVLVQEGFAILGIAVGVALLFASQVASTSLTHSVTQLNSQLVGSAQVQLEARGPEGVREQLLEAVRRVPGVQVALPVFDRQMNVIGPGGERSVNLIGVDPHSVRASGPLLRRFSAKQLAVQQAIALPAPLAREIGRGPLEPVKLQIGADFVETLVGATLEESDIGGLVHSPVAVASIGYAQRLARVPGQISRIFVRFNPARERSPRRARAPCRDVECQSCARRVRFAFVCRRRGAREQERDAVLWDKRPGRLHVRTQRHAHNGAIPAQAD